MKRYADPTRNEALKRDKKPAIPATNCTERADYKFTSQANQLSKLMDLKQEAERQDLHQQRLYKRRRLIDEQGSIKSNWSTLAENSALEDG